RRTWRRTARWRRRGATAARASSGAWVEPRRSGVRGRGVIAMRYAVLGRAKLDVSVGGLGAGAGPGPLAGGRAGARPAGVARALEAGVNWIDTAAGYGDGRSEASIGRALRQLRAAGRMHVATKVRLSAEDLSDPETAVRRSLAGSLARLGLDRVTLLQLHN